MEGNGQLRAQHYDLCSSPNISRFIKRRRLSWGEHVERMGDKRRAYRVLVGKAEGKRPQRRLWFRWEYNIEMYLQEVGRGYGLDWSSSAWGEVAGSCGCGNEHSVFNNTRNLLTI